jgi:SulP family sulfate permease
VEVHGRVVQGIPPVLPRFSLPWTNIVPGAVPFNFSLETIQALVPSAFAIAMLGAIESLLSAVVADGMAQTRHDPDAELVALGIGNIVCPFFGGIPATGAIARTATNIRFGARSPISAIIHAVFTLFVLVVFSPIVSYLPMAALAALLMLVAYNMSEIKHFGHILKVAPRSDVTVLLLCFGLTVIFDMVVGVTVGIVLAAILFMNRMASITSGQKLVGSHQVKTQEPIPNEILLYEISGPFFFGATESAISALRGTTDSIKAVIFLMENVPAMDVTGLVAFESTVRDLKRWGTKVFVVGIRPQPATLLKKSELVEAHEIDVSSSLEEALAHAKKVVQPGAGAAATPG